MPHSKYLPEKMGSATVEPSGSFEAGSYQSFKLTYTAGEFTYKLPRVRSIMAPILFSTRQLNI